jgi:hypothetical protein
MATTFSKLPPWLQHFVAEAFAARDEAESWIGQLHSQSPEFRKTTTFAEIYDFATAPGTDRDGRIRAELRSNGRLARNFAALLDRLNAYSMPAQVAAATGASMERFDEVSGIRLRLIESAAATREMHLVIETGDIAPAAIRTLYALPRDGGCVTLPLDEADGGLIHMLLERNNEILRYLLDPSTELKFK